MSIQNRFTRTAYLNQKATANYVLQCTVHVDISILLQCIFQNICFNKIFRLIPSRNIWKIFFVLVFKYLICLFLRLYDVSTIMILTCIVYSADKSPYYYYLKYQYMWEQQAFFFLQIRPGKKKKIASPRTVFEIKSHFGIKGNLEYW